jgi:hypothetical protein
LPTVESGQAFTSNYQFTENIGIVEYWSIITGYSQPVPDGRKRCRTNNPFITQINAKTRKQNR